MRRWPQLLRHCCYLFTFCFAIWFIVSIDAQQIAPAQVPIAAAPAAQVLPQPVPVVPVAPPGALPGQPIIGPQLTPFYAENLVPFGPEVGDHEVFPGMLNPGQMIDLHMFFPFYGGLYNYSIISVNGYIGFAHIFNQGPVLNVGVENTDWPRQPDPAMIAPWLCKQQITQEPQPGMRAGVFFRLVLRRSLFGRPPNELLNVAGVPLSSFFNQPASQACPGTPDSYIQCNQQSDLFLELMMQWLQEGVAGAVAFRADAALVVTWLNTASGISGRSDLGLGQLATYQAIWLTDQTARLSYVILNYDKLGFDADDFRFNSRNGRCQALFNGGNHTGTVPVDPTIPYKHSPKILARRSGVPHLARGRYMFRVDDVVRPGGCSNKTAGTYPMLIYPNIVNMLGETTVDVNALCLERSQTYILMIEQRETATCVVLNSAIARCFLPRVFDWGTKTVYFQTQQGNLNAQEDKAFVGYIYFVPPTIDPMRLDIGNVYDWFKNPVPFQLMPISWYPRNFTNPDYFTAEQIFQIGNDAMYSVQLGLYVIGYREAQDNKIRKFRPEYRTLCRLATFTNRNTYEYRFRPQDERINIYQVEQWYLNEWERMNEMYTYRFGYMKLAPLRPNDVTGMNLLPGLISSPISIHWLWQPMNIPTLTVAPFTPQQQESRIKFVEEKATQMCQDWYAEDGAQYNFIRYTETNASCPCIESQARIDLGRFMPHPRCSQVFRDISCTTIIGAQNCYLSAQNVYTSYYAGEGQRFNAQNTAPFETHYGQVCCYDGEGKLMQSTYQPVVKVIDQYPYNPGYPTRAYEFGTYPYMGQYEVPSFSAFYHDYMPYFFCCKYAQYRCQLFYWRRPTSGCQEYQPPATGYVQGAGSFTTLDNRKFVFNEPGVFTLLHIPQTLTNPEVRIQIRLERYPNRRVDFGLFGRYISQADLVQPTNATVVTGIALEATGTDRVVVVARKDTRRYRYRTSVIVGNIIRYFDNMKLQKFKGVLVYVNNVEYGQAEVYVVLEAAQIGVRIRESYALDIARLPMYYESMGLLDIELSVPPRYGVQPSGERPFGATPFPTMFQFPPVSGLMRPNPEGQPGLLNVPLTLNEVNSANIVQQLVTSYRIPGGAGAGIQPAGPLALGVPTENLFITSQENYKKYDVFPEAAIKALPIYKTAERFESGPYRFIPKDGMMINQLLQTCRNLQLNPPLNPVPVQRQIVQQYGASECPNNPAEIISNCGDSVPCLYDYTMLNSKTLGIEALNAWNNFVIDRTTGSRHYNSCGAIMIEYPAYMLKTPSLASGYLQGDIASFSCYQTHWIKGDYEYKCGLVADYRDPTRYSFQWNKGWQPWCRSREKDNMFQWLTGIFTTVGIIMMIAVVFLAFWCIKQKRRSESEEKIFRESTTFAPTVFESYPSREKTIDGEVFHISRPRSPQRGTVLDRGRVYDTNLGPSRTSTPASAELRSRRAGLMGFKTSV